jgi:hypothetical protein
MFHNPESVKTEFSPQTPSRISDFDLGCLVNISSAADTAATTEDWVAIRPPLDRFAPTRRPAFEEDSGRLFERATSCPERKSNGSIRRGTDSPRRTSSGKRPHAHRPGRRFHTRRTCFSASARLSADHPWPDRPPSRNGSDLLPEYFVVRIAGVIEHWALPPARMSLRLGESVGR